MRIPGDVDKMNLEHGECILVAGGKQVEGPGKGGWEEGRWDVLTASSEPSVLSLTWGTRSSAKTEDDGGGAGGSRKRQKV